MLQTANTPTALLLCAALCAGAPRAAPAMRGPAPPPEAFPTTRVVEVARPLGCRVTPLPGGGLALAGTGPRLTLTPDSRKLLADEVLVWLNAPTSGHGRAMRISTVDASSTMEPLLRFDAGPRRSAGAVPRIVLDPGHGGADSGAIGPGGLREKDLVLDIARRVHRLLHAHGAHAMLTRPDDRDMSLADRAASARRWNADVFLSIHLNAASNPHASGVETYVLSADGHASTSGAAASYEPWPGSVFDADSMRLAFAVHRRVLAAADTEDRGIRRARFSLLRSAPCPAALLECGFLSHAAEENRLRMEAHRQRLAEAIAAGTMAYFSVPAATGTASLPRATDP